MENANPIFYFFYFLSNNLLACEIKEKKYYLKQCLLSATNKLLKLNNKPRFNIVETSNLILVVISVDLPKFYRVNRIYEFTFKIQAQQDF